MMQTPVQFNSIYRSFLVNPFNILFKLIELFLIAIRYEFCAYEGCDMVGIVSF